MAGIYIHIPFCRQACHYCDFHFSTSLKQKDAFIQALLKEIKLRKNYLPAKEAIGTIYLGGGTPSLLEQQDLEKIFSMLHACFEVDKNAEVTLEANPDDLTDNRINMLKGTPVNRLSIGIQSFDNAELRWMNRAHDAQMAAASVRRAQDAGFANISVDLIYGSPLLSNENWIKNLQRVHDMQVPHLSAYSLTVESRTALADMIKKNKTAAPDENKSAEQLGLLMEFAKGHQLEQYEISNFCRDGKYSRHNSSYWKRIPYIGFGPSAHSYDGLSRQWNISNNTSYIKSIDEGTVPFTSEILTRTQAYNEYIMTSLRTKWGVSHSILHQQAGEELAAYFSAHVKSFIADGTVQENEQVYTLTDKGKFLADRIASDLFYVDGDRS